MKQFLVPNNYDKTLPRTIKCRICGLVKNLKNQQVHFHCGSMVAVLTTRKKCIVNGCTTQAFETKTEDGDYCIHHYYTKDRNCLT